MLKVCICAVAGLAATGLCAQEKMTGEELVYICEGTKEADHAFCEGYVNGVSEGGYTAGFMHLLLTGVEPEKAFNEISTITRICYDGMTTEREIAPRVIETIKATPDLLSVQASLAVTYSLQLLFPCE